MRREQNFSLVSLCSEDKSWNCEKVCSSQKILSSTLMIHTWLLSLINLEILPLASHLIACLKFMSFSPSWWTEKFLTYFLFLSFPLSSFFSPLFFLLSVHFWYYFLLCSTYKNGWMEKQQDGLKCLMLPSSRVINDSTFFDFHSMMLSRDPFDKLPWLPSMYVQILSLSLFLSLSFLPFHKDLNPFFSWISLLLFPAFLIFLVNFPSPSFLISKTSCHWCHSWTVLFS